MKIARFPAVSSWFRESLFAEIPPEQVAADEPADALLTGVAGPNRRTYTAWVRVADRQTFAESTTAAAAYRLARERFLAVESAA